VGEGKRGGKGESTGRRSLGKRKEFVPLRNYSPARKLSEGEKRGKREYPRHAVEKKRRREGTPLLSARKEGTSVHGRGGGGERSVQGCP